MKPFFNTISLVCLFCFFPLIYPQNSFAGVDLPWSTTFNCADWTQSDGVFNCDGVQNYGGWTCGNLEERIFSDANYSSGGGGKGQRHYEGDGSNNNSGGTIVYFNGYHPEIWVRWYMKYSSGFAWDSGESNPLLYDKILYFDVGTTYATIPEWHYWGWFNFWTYQGGNHDGTSWGWTKAMGGQTSDGNWHCYEVHLNKNTGVAQLWFDGVLKVNLASVDFGSGHPGFKKVVFGSNQRYPDNCAGTCCDTAYVDFDDIAISNTGYIGPITAGGGEAAPPSPPQDLKLR